MTPVDVFNSTVYSNPYQEMLYSDIAARYRLVAGSLEKALASTKRNPNCLFHIHWEESIFAKCTSSYEADDVRRDYVLKLKRYVARGGKLVWTVHNAMPHEQRAVRAFISLRRSLASLADIILTHNRAGVELLRNQAKLNDFSRVRILPHPSYLGVYEPTERTVAKCGLEPVCAKSLLHFGLIRDYKGLPKLLDWLPPEFMESNSLALSIHGRSLLSEMSLASLNKMCATRTDVKLTLSSVPSAAVPDTLRAHAGLLIPYDNTLTSGVALLALTFGVPTIAPRTQTMLDLFPESVHPLLFHPGSGEDFRIRVLMLANLTCSQRKKIARDSVQKAQLYHPQQISKSLGEIYDALIKGGAETRTDGAN